MGNKQSTTYRRVQPSLSHSFKYNRLSSPSSFDNQQPLLVNNHDENVEQLKREIEENRKKNKSLERRNVSLEKDMQEFKTVIISNKETPNNMEKKVAALEKQLLELKSTISKLQSTSSEPVTPGPHATESKDTLLKVEKLELRVMKVELDHLTSQRKQDMAEKAKKNAELDKQLIERIPIPQTKATYSAETDHLVTPMEKEFGNPGHESINDLVGCLMVLILLVAILIGLNL